MRKNNQHNTFDDLLAFHAGRLDLQKANYCRNHLDACEECQNTLEAIQEFNRIELRQPHIQYVEKELDENLLNITKKYIRKSQKGICSKILYRLSDKDLLKYCALIAASVLLVFLFSMMNQPKETNEIVEKTAPIDIAMEKYNDMISALSQRDSSANINGTYYSLSLRHESKQYPAPFQKKSDSIEMLEWNSHNKNIVAQIAPDSGMQPLDITPDSIIILYDDMPSNIQVVEGKFIQNPGLSGVSWNPTQITIEETLKRKYQPFDTISIEKIKITSISPNNTSKLDLIITNNLKPDLPLSEMVVKNKVKSRGNLPKERNYTQHQSNYKIQNNYRMVH